MSQLLLRLKRDYGSAVSAHQRAEVSARIACYLARVGEFERARRIVANIRKTYFDGRSGRVTVWLMLAEGLILFFEDRPLDGLDRIRRALLLSISMGYDEFVAIAAAWQAHIQFNKSDFSEVVTSLKLVETHLTNLNLDARARRALVMCESFIMGGDRALEQRWFRVAHECAVRNGDQAGIEAAQYNRAAYLTARIRVEHCKGQLLPDYLARVRKEVESANNLNALIKSSGLLKHVGLLDARLLLMEGHYKRAITVFRLVERDAPSNTHHFDPAYLQLEITFCHFRLHQSEDVDTFLRGRPVFEFPELDVDDRLFGYWMLAKMAASDLRFGSANEWQNKLFSSVIAYDRMHSDLLEHLKMLNSPSQEAALLGI